jgi:hypothetical protein
MLLVMPSGLHRTYGAHHLHFITCSCYRRLPFLKTARTDLSSLMLYLENEGEFLEECRIVILEEAQREIQKSMTVYNFDTIAVDGKPEVHFKSLKKLVGERGFEPPTPWSRTRFQQLVSFTELYRPQVVFVERVAAST